MGNQTEPKAKGSARKPLLILYTKTKQQNVFWRQRCLSETWREGERKTKLKMAKFNCSIPVFVDRDFIALVFQSPWGHILVFQHTYTPPPSSVYSLFTGLFKLHHFPCCIVRYAS